MSNFASLDFNSLKLIKEYGWKKKIDLIEASTSKLSQQSSSDRVASAGQI
jgi:hypothetical protein